MRSLVTQPPVTVGGGSQPANPNKHRERIGYGTDGLKVLVTAGTANTKGNYATIGTTTSALCGFWLDVGLASSAGARYILDVRIGGATVILPNFFLHPGATIFCPIYIPLQIPAATLVEVRTQSGTASATLRIGISGVVADVAIPAGFTQATALLGDLTSTLPSTINVPLASTIAWTTQLTTAADYGALLVTFDSNGAIVTAQDVGVTLATGLAAAEVEFALLSGYFTASSSSCQRGQGLIEKAIASGTRLSAGALAVTPGTDNIRVGLHGFA